MQFPVGAPVGHLNQLVQRKILHIDKQYPKVCVPGDGVECFRDGQARLPDLGTFVVGAQAGPIAAVERHDGQVVVGKHGGVDPSHRHGCGDGDGRHEKQVEEEDGCELQYFLALVHFVECVTRIDVEGVVLQLEGAADG